MIRLADVCLELKTQKNKWKEKMDAEPWEHTSMKRLMMNISFSFLPWASQALQRTPCFFCFFFTFFCIRAAMDFQISLELNLLPTCDESCFRWNRAQARVPFRLKNRWAKMGRREAACRSTLSRHLPPQLTPPLSCPLHPFQMNIPPPSSRKCIRQRESLVQMGTRFFRRGPVCVFV